MLKGERGDPGPGCPEQNGLRHLRDDLHALRAAHGSTDDDRQTFELRASSGPQQSRRRGETVVRRGAVGSGEVQDLKAKDEEEASRIRTTKRGVTKTVTMAQKKGG